MLMKQYPPTYKYTQEEKLCINGRENK